MLEVRKSISSRYLRVLDKSHGGVRLRVGGGGLSSDSEGVKGGCPFNESLISWNQSTSGPVNEFRVRMFLFTEFLTRGTDINNALPDLK